jgi:hypothetical protein
LKEKSIYDKSNFMLKKLVYGNLIIVIFILILSFPILDGFAGVNLSISPFEVQNEEIVVFHKEYDEVRIISAEMFTEIIAINHDWPQVQNNPQRTGYSPEVLGTNFQVVWTRPFQPEKVHPQVQAIVYDGKVFVGTEMGNMYALNAQTGAQVWKYSVNSPILNSVAAGDGRVYFGAMDGAVYALNASTGGLIWKSPLSWRHGFSTAPVFAENKVMLGGRDGIFYALNTSTGDLLWQYNVGSPILQTAAWNDGKAYFGTMDMHVYAIHTENGSLVWKSDKLLGMAFKDYWPVVYNGKVIMMPMGKKSGDSGISPGFPFIKIWDSSDPRWDWYMQYGPTVATGNLVNIPEAMEAQDQIMDDYLNDPSSFTKYLYILDETSGKEDIVIPHWTVQTMHGGTTPPCIDRDGFLVLPVNFIRSGWARVDLNIQRVVDILYDHRKSNGAPMEPGSYPAGMGNRDENLNVTCAGNLILAMHTQEGNANYTGAFDLTNRSWIPIMSGHTNRQMSTNTQGGGGNPASIANGMIYHISFHELIARSTE